MESNGPSSFKNRGAQPNDQNGGLFFPLFYSIIGAQMPNVYDIDQTSWTAWKSTLSKQRAPSVYFKVKQLTDLMLQKSAGSNPIGSNIFYFFFFSPYVLTMNPTIYVIIQSPLNTEILGYTLKKIKKMQALTGFVLAICRL